MLDWAVVGAVVRGCTGTVDVRGTAVVLVVEDSVEVVFLCSADVGDVAGTVAGVPGAEKCRIKNQHYHCNKFKKNVNLKC